MNTKTNRRPLARLMAVLMALAMIVSVVFMQASAAKANFDPPRYPMDIDKNQITVAAHSQGYITPEVRECKRIFKVHHTREECEEELNLFVDCGAVVKDVFVSHRAYGVLRGELDIRSRLDVQNFLESIRSGKSTLLSSTTEGYHYHTLLAPSEEVLDMIENRLWEMGFLAKTLDYEPEELQEKVCQA